MTDGEMLRNYLMEERRILRDRVSSIERTLGLDSKEKALERRIVELERRLIANGSVSPVPVLR